jgi:lipopolysaccharide export system protein LptA/lipopolysaccharide export system protein LptC
MKRSEAARYARWSAAAALLLATLTVGVYLQRKWVEHREQRKAPPPAPRDVTKLTNGITFSKGAGTQKIFTVEAGKATDFKDQDASLLEDVKVTIFGKIGARHDIIHTQSCQYDKVSGNIACSGDVKIDFESAADAERLAKNPEAVPPQRMHVETRGVTFNRVSGIAQSDQPVQFVFPNGEGQAAGVEYHSEEGTVRLLRDVRMLLAPPKDKEVGKSAAQTSLPDPVHVTGKSLDFARDSRVMHLHGPVEAMNTKARLTADEVTLTLDTAFHAEKLVATGKPSGKNPEVTSQQTDGATNLSAEILTAYFAPEGWLTKIDGTGNVQGSRRGAKEEDEFSAQNGVLDLLPKVNQPKELNLKGNVLMKTRANSPGAERELRTSALKLEFAESQKGQGSKPKHAETLSAGSIEWTDPATPSGAPGTAASGAPARTKLQADKLELEFGPEGKARQLLASGNVQTERAVAGSPLQTATAQSGVAQLLATGGWSQMDLQGNVKLREADRSGQADHALFLRAAQTALLTGKASARDATTETHAPRITFNQASGDIHAEGGVRSTDFSAKSSAVQLAPAPVNISSDSLQANSKSGRALYTGHARLWQGDSVMEADSIELLRETKVLNAVGNVRAVFPQTAGQPGTPAMGVQAAPSKTQLWHLTAGTLTYRDAENRAHLEKNVVAQSADQKMRAPIVDLYFTRSAAVTPAAANGSAAASPAPGAQQINRALGTGGVVVDQGTRTAKAERGEYSAADGKFVMSGGTPTIYDAAEGTTTGRQLTFFLADDTIIVDSENGSRTLTKHRVEK